MKQCKQCNKTFQIDPEDLEFYQRIEVPEPTMCPDCRQQRRLAWCNEMTLYPRQCPKCKKNILSIFSPDSPYIILCHDCWWSDKWDGTDYGQEINWNEKFFKQFQQLILKVPQIAANTSGRNVNCDYVHYCGDSKNCYLTFHADFNENCYYGYGIKKSKECVDAYNNFNCELCYQCIDCHDCYNLKWSADCLNCYDSYFLKDCVGCRNCFGAAGLRNQEYYFFDKKLSQSEYENKMRSINLGSYQEINKYLEKALTYQQTKFYKFMQGNKNENSTGNNLYHTRNLKDSYDCSEIENGKYCFQLSLKAKDCYDFYQYGLDSELVYESTICGKAYNIKFCHYVFDKCQNLEYCINCASCKNCFGCISLKHREFCIFNKQYSEQEYNKQVKKLKDKMKKDSEYGQFFPPNLSFFGYNETSAHWWHPLKKEEAAAQGYKWQNNLPEIKGKQTVSELADNIKDVRDDILKEILICDKCKKNYKIISQELAYYKRQNIPLPRLCFSCRHLARRMLRNPRSLWHRQCMCTQPDHGHNGRCGQEFETTYSPERKEIVYCEECYNKEIY